MSFMSFAGRVLFSAVFLLSAYLEFSEFGADGGPAAKALRPKYNRFVKHVSSHLGIVVPHIEVTLSLSFSLFLLLLLLLIFYNIVQMKHILASTIFLKGFGGILFVLSSSLGAYLLLLYLAFITPVVYDFYNYDIEKPEFVQLFNRFAQNVALFGALLFFLSMKNTIARRQSKRLAPKSKTN
ncbi:hypothetical protein ZIOFF_037271 [Zingiber officinale]|uniref:Uncharacterized protein n=1 Tax=Zingiber officinale TaxID=94328 RepID=A0A8J5KZE2_ZINOF|nr:hypothetical protein ZIOFF_037271 [Zingiber officinale]